MFINSVQNFTPSFQSNSIIINGKKYIPLSEYKGPKLKLTSKEQSKINVLRQNITNLELEHLKLAESYQNNEDLMFKRDCQDNAFLILRSKIETLKNEIKKITTNRYKIQLEKMAKAQDHIRLH